MPTLIHAFALFNFFRSRGRNNRRRKRNIRHQNPRMNDKGTAPAPALPPRRLSLIPVSTRYAQPGFCPSPKPLIENEEIQTKPTKKRADDGRLFRSRIPVPARRLPDIEINAGQSVVQEGHVLKGPKGAASTIAFGLTNDKPHTAKQSDSGTSPATPTLPRIPHQRMHYLRRLGEGGEGYCHLFRLHSPPQPSLLSKRSSTNPI
ncbi:MAG: hypothetical protein Q9201_006999 [Fulgogasparrea decipioides]